MVCVGGVENRKTKKREEEIIREGKTKGEGVHVTIKAQRRTISGKQASKGKEEAQWGSDGKDGVKTG